MCAGWGEGRGSICGWEMFAFGLATNSTSIRGNDMLCQGNVRSSNLTGTPKTNMGAGCHDKLVNGYRIMLLRVQNVQKSVLK